MTPFVIMTPVKNVPIIAKSAQIPCVWNAAFLKLTSPTRTASLFTMIFEVCRAMKQMKRPMPAATAFFRENGMQLKIASLTGVSDRARKTSPSTNTANSANCQL